MDIQQQCKAARAALLAEESPVETETGNTFSAWTCPRSMKPAAPSVAAAANSSRTPRDLRIRTPAPAARPRRNCSRSSTNVVAAVGNPAIGVARRRFSSSKCVAVVSEKVLAKAVTYRRQRCGCFTASMIPSQRRAPAKIRRVVLQPFDPAMESKVKSGDLIKAREGIRRGQWRRGGSRNAASLASILGKMFVSVRNYTLISTYLDAGPAL